MAIDGLDVAALIQGQVHRNLEALRHDSRVRTRIEEGVAEADRPIDEDEIVPSRVGELRFDDEHQIAGGAPNVVVDNNIELHAERVLHQEMIHNDEAAPPWILFLPGAEIRDIERRFLDANVRPVHRFVVLLKGRERKVPDERRKPDVRPSDLSQLPSGPCCLVETLEHESILLASVEVAVERILGHVHVAGLLHGEVSRDAFEVLVLDLARA